MTPEDYGRLLAQAAPPLTDDQAAQAARLLLSFEKEAAA